MAPSINFDPNGPGFPSPRPLTATPTERPYVTPDADLDVARLTPSPPVTAPAPAEAIRACRALSGGLSRLIGQAHDNKLLTRGHGQHRYVSKIAHLRAFPSVVVVQIGVLRHIAS